MSPDQRGNEQRLKIVFMGSPDFAVPCLERLHQRHQVQLVVTQPDRPRGRGRRLAKPPIKVAAERLGLDVIQPETLRRKSVRMELAALQPDLFVVVAFGQILRPRMLAVPTLGCVNVHASLLPRHRGAAPIQWAVLDGDDQSGVSIMMLDEGVDTGPVLVQRAVPLAPDETAGSLHDKLAPLGARLLMEAIEGLAAGSLAAQPQDDAAATMARMLTKQDSVIDFRRAAEHVARWIRGLDPWPGAHSFVDGERLALYDAVVGEGSGEAGVVLAVEARGMLVACGEGAVWIRGVQLAGKRRMAPKALAAGRPIPRGTVLGQR